MPILVLQLDTIDPPGRVGDWLRAAGAEVAHVQLDRGDPLPDLAGHDGLVVLGGAMGVNDDDRVPYLAGVKALLRAAVRDGMPTLAICLGAQLLAAANGGRVTVNPQGPELGAQLIAKRAAASSDPLLGPVPITPDVIQWHYDTIAALPPGAVRLASSPVCENQAFRLGRLAWGFQFHIETTPELVRTWARNDAARLNGLDLDAIVTRSDAVHDDVAEVWAPVVAAFVAIARDPGSVPAAQGVPSSTAAPVTDPAAIRAALAAEMTAARAPLPMPVPMPLPMPTTREPITGAPTSRSDD